MKKILATIAALVITISGIGQTITHEIGRYKITITYSDTADMVVNIRMSHKSHIILKGNEVENFVNTLNEIDKKASEWYRIAVNNDIDSLDKEMPINVSKINIINDTNTYNITPKVIFWYKSSFLGIKNFLSIHVRFNTPNNQYPGLIFRGIDNIKELADFLDIDNLNEIIDQYKTDQMIYDEIFN